VAGRLCINMQATAPAPQRPDRAAALSRPQTERTCVSVSDEGGAATCGQILTERYFSKNFGLSARAATSDLLA
jgi:hypothetical protein